MADTLDPLDLTFDTDSFKQSVDKMTETFNKFSDSMQKKDTKRGNEMKMNAKATAKGMMQAFGKLAMIGGIFVAAFQGLKKVVSAIPEIGMTFKIAGEIFMRNFIWPLRKMLIPLLNQFLAWVRNSRTLFIAWGSILANIFKVIFITIKSAITLIKTLFSSFLKGLNDMYKGAFGNLTDLVNMILFKIAMVIAFITAKIQPLMEVLGTIFAKLVKIVANFVKGFVEGFLEVANNLGTMEKLKGLLEGISTILEGLEPAFKGLGKIIGTTIGVAFNLVINKIKLFTDLLGNLVQFATGKMSGKDFLEASKTAGAEYIKSEIDAYKQLGQGLFEAGKDTAKDYIEMYKQNKANRKVNDAIIRPNGDVIETHPMDTLIATKNPEKLGGANINLNFSNNFNISGGDNIRQKVIESTKVMMEQIRMGLMDEYVLQGNR